MTIGRFLRNVLAEAPTGAHHPPEALDAWLRRQPPSVHQMLLDAARRHAEGQGGRAVRALQQAAQQAGQARAAVLWLADAGQRGELEVTG